MKKDDRRINFKIGDKESPETPYYYQWDGQKVWLNEEGYRYLHSLDDQERKRMEQESRCPIYNKNGLLTKCRGKCAECPMYQRYGRIGGTLSMEALQEGNGHIDFVSSDDVVRKYEEGEFREAVDKALLERDELDRMAFSLCFEEGRPEREASSLLAISQPAIHKRIANLKSYLQEKLKDFAD